MNEAWRAWAVDVPADRADELAGLLALQCLGTVLDPAGPDAVRLTLFGDETTDYGAICEGLAAFGVQVNPVPVAVENRDWVADYQGSLRSLPLGERFVVLPHDKCRIPPEWQERTTIRLTPGQAFGTGEHPTTRLCARALEQSVRTGSRWLDVGAGSGILSLVAANLGARVDAVEIDPQASEVADGVLEANAVPVPVRWITGGLEAAPGTGYDGLVINIFSSFFQREAARIRALLGREGRLIASGFLLEDLEDMDAWMGSVGLQRESTPTADPWAGWIGKVGG